MSQVDLLPPPVVALPSSAEKDTYVTKEPSGEPMPNNSDKQLKGVLESSTLRIGPSSFRCDKNSLAERENVKPPNNNTNNNTHPTNSKPKKHRRGKKRKWKPYFKLTWVERKQLQDREEKRAEKVRADMSASGLTLAPYNTTQFLMDDHNLQEPDYEHIPVGHRLNHHHAKENHQQQNGVDNGNQDSSDDFYSSPEDEEDFLQQQFTETYKTIHAERLSNMSQAELVQELMTLEDRVEALQKTLKTVEDRPETTNDPEKHQEQLEKIRVFENEIRKLTEQNERLKRENDDLRLMLRPGSETSI